jgi:hypothetical protein
LTPSGARVPSVFRQGKNSTSETGAKPRQYLLDAASELGFDALDEVPLGSSEIDDAQAELFEPDERYSINIRLRTADALHKGGAYKEADRVGRCGALTMALACGEGHVTLTHEGCDNRLCPSCQPAMAMRTKEHAYELAEWSMAQGLRLVHAVFTVPNTKDISSEKVGEMQKKWGFNLRRRKAFKDWVAGAYRSTELVRGAGGWDWHPHLHSMLALRPGFKDYGELMRELALEWHGLTGCSVTCKVKRQSLKMQPADIADWDSSAGCRKGGSVWLGRVIEPMGKDSAALARSAAFEVAKYVTKGSEFWVDDGAGGYVDPSIADVARAIRGRSLTQKYGVFRKLKRVKHPSGCRDCSASNLTLIDRWHRACEAVLIGPHPEPPRLLNEHLVRLGTADLVSMRAAMGDAVCIEADRLLRAIRPDLYVNRWRPQWLTRK